MNCKGLKVFLTFLLMTTLALTVLVSCDGGADDDRASFSATVHNVGEEPLSAGNVELASGQSVRVTDPVTVLGPDGSSYRVAQSGYYELFYSAGSINRLMTSRALVNTDGWIAYYPRSTLVEVPLEYPVPNGRVVSGCITYIREGQDVIIPIAFLSRFRHYSRL